MVAPSERRPRDSRGSLFRSPYVIAAFLLVVVAVILLLLEPPESNQNESILESMYRISATYDSSDNPFTSTPAIAQAQGQPAYDQSINPLAIPPGQAQNLPSIRVDETLKQRNRQTKYGGKHDKKHLGGFTAYDTAGVSPSVWKLMIQEFGVKSLLDVGCGRGTSTTWFLTHGVDVLCAEGSHDAYEKTFLPDPATQMIEHDFSRGPWWPEKTFDAAWSVEFLEHVNLQYHYNYITAFRKAALIFVSTSRWGGWHHVEVHQDEWWIRKYELYGLRYDAKLTLKVRELAKVESKNNTIMAPDGMPYNAQHIWLTMKVFTNPVVAALPQHAHLFPEFGCYDAEGNRRECGTGKNSVLETALEKSLYPLELTPEMDKEWDDLIRKNLAIIKAQDATKNAQSTTAAGA
jgi:2-polyprenyl-3-methyl-5-hydroxy-6-metoxy-1,4-benzoquinol methylase